MSKKMDDNRLFDLVRYQRVELHEAGLITGEEYADLMNDTRSKEAVKRLGTYDDMKAKLEKTEIELDKLWECAEIMANQGYSFAIWNIVTKHNIDMACEALEVK